MLTKHEIRNIIKNNISRIQTNYNVERLGLFGSFVRGEETATSDVDILVEFKKSADLFDSIGLALFLEEKIGQKVDVVSANALREELKGPILKGVTYI